MAVFSCILWIAREAYVGRPEETSHLQTKMPGFSCVLSDGRSALPASWTSRDEFLLPATLREFAGLEKDVLLAGMLDHIEIWNEERWKENADFGDMDMIASHLNYLNNKRVRIEHMEFNHYSVMLHETIEELHIKPDGIYVDGTLGWRRTCL